MDFAIPWLILLIIFAVIEIATKGLTTIWFAAGALVALVLQSFGIGTGIQIVVFVIVSLIFLLVTRPVAARYLNPVTTKTNAEALVGRTVRVTGDISNLKGEGQVTVGGMEWTARSTDDTITFAKGELVTVAGIEGVKLIVRKKEEDI